MSDWKRQPLVHFLLLGGLLFGAYAYFGQPEKGTDDRTVVVTEPDVERLRQAWAGRWHRDPTEQELEEMVDGWVREEILYRAAKELGLDDGDAIVRQRLLEKIGYLMQSGTEQRKVSDEELHAYYTARPEIYRVPARRSFTHIYFGVELRGEDAWRDAEAVLEDLSRMSPSPERAPDLGDRFAMQYDYRRRSRSEISRHMGPEFAEWLFGLDVDGWRGPVRSAYGVHLVRVLERSESSPLSFETVRDQVREDLQRERREAGAEEFFAQLKSEYKVIRGDGG